MPTKSLTNLIRKNSKAVVHAAEAKAQQDKASVPAAALSAPPTPAQAFARQAISNLSPAKVSGTLDTIEPMDPYTLRVQATTRMPGETHKPATFKLDKRLIVLLDVLSRKQNIAALYSHLVVRGLASVLQEMQAQETTTFHVSYDTDDRNAFCGVPEPALLALVRALEEAANSSSHVQ